MEPYKYKILRLLNHMRKINSDPKSYYRYTLFLDKGDKITVRIYFFIRTMNCYVNNPETTIDFYNHPKDPVDWVATFENVVHTMFKDLSDDRANASTEDPMMCSMVTSLPWDIRTGKHTEITPIMYADDYTPETIPEDLINAYSDKIDKWMYKGLYDPLKDIFNILHA